SASSSGGAFVTRLAPRLALVSVGRDNVYGHPSPAALARLAGAGAAIVRTDLEGALWFELSAAGARRVAWTRGADRGAPAPRALPAPAPRE
ncbi:MAG TPA: hypothetical protein VGU27_11310, partial [Candidatus Eisenbacteria bacterium]|nr:hypothetical protein [Candidatus Eisenbacteria bacterium]